MQTKEFEKYADSQGYVKGSEERAIAFHAWWVCEQVILRQLKETAPKENMALKCVAVGGV